MRWGLKEAESKHVGVTNKNQKGGVVHPERGRNDLPVSSERLMERVLDRGGLLDTFRQMRRNRELPQFYKRSLY